MVHTIELLKTDDGEGAFLPLPPEILSHLGVSEGDSVVVTFVDGVLQMKAHRE